MIDKELYFKNKFYNVLTNSNYTDNYDITNIPF